MDKQNDKKDEADTLLHHTTMYIQRTYRTFRILVVVGPEKFLTEM